jgi:hypothetical protein
MELKEVGKSSVVFDTSLYDGDTGTRLESLYLTITGHLKQLSGVSGKIDLFNSVILPVTDKWENFV